MDVASRADENWGVLGEQIAKSRRTKGWDQKELARRSENSPNTISNYERGRVPRGGRVPAGLMRVSDALGWPMNAVGRILSGSPPEEAVTAPDTTAPRLRGAHEMELTQSGIVAQDTFVRQMKRFRKLQEVEVAQLAVRMARLGGKVSVPDLARIESGTRRLQPTEAELIAEALDTSVEWLLGSGFSDDAPDALKLPPTAEELEIEAKAMESRIAEASAHVNAAQEQMWRAKEMEEQAKQHRYLTEAAFRQADMEQRELERQHQYLIGRIDSLRELESGEQIMQTHPVYKEDSEAHR